MTPDLLACSPSPSRELLGWPQVYQGGSANLWSFKSSLLHWKWLISGWLLCITEYCLHASQVQEVAFLSTLILGWWTRGLPESMGLIYPLVHSSSVSHPPSEATPKLPNFPDAGMLWAVTPHGTRREVVRDEFALFSDAQYTVDLFLVPHLTRYRLGTDSNVREATLMLVPCQCTWTCAWPWN